MRYYDDLIVTHGDAAYMASHYELREGDGSMYFVRTDPADRCGLKAAQRAWEHWG